MIGPLEFIVIAFDNGDFHGEIASELTGLIRRGDIRIIDLVFVRKGDGGMVSITEISEIDDPDLAPFAHLAGDVAGLLTPEDLQQLATAVPDRAAAIIALFEHTWAIGIRAAIEAAGGRLVLSERVPAEAVEELNSELATAGAITGGSA